MRTKKIAVYAAVLVIILSSAFACSDSDGYSLNNFRVSIATVVPEGMMDYSLILDDGTKLRLATSDVYYKPHPNQRALVNYTILTDETDGFDHYVKVNDIWNVLTKPIIEMTAASADSIGNDKVRANEFWIGDNYLNVSFSFNYGGVRPHAINMVQNLQTAQEDDGVLELEFRHNSYKSPNNRLFDGFAAFDLRSFREEGRDSIPITIKVKDWDGDHEYKLMYRYNELNKPRLAATIPSISSNEYE